MAKKQKGEITQAAEARPLEGYKVIATVKEGWRYSANGDGRLIFVHPDHQPRIVDINSVEEGDVLPRDTDEVLSFPSQVTGS